MARPYPMTSAEWVPLLRSVVARGGHLELRAVGLSMVPAVQPGDRLVLGPLEPGEPRPGQLVLWEADGVVRVHRVVSAGAGQVTTRGDACPTDDPPVSREQVVAAVRLVRRPWLLRLRRLASRLLRGQPDPNSRP